MSGLIERIDISKMMLMQENNLIAKYAGKRLQDITLEGNVFVILDKISLTEKIWTNPVDHNISLVYFQ